MRPETLGQYIGQDHITGSGTLIRSAIENDRIFSMILWGPPGCGKTTLARIIAKQTKTCFLSISAVFSGVKQIREVIEEAEKQRSMYNRRTLLFVDEIHRFNKAQQDAFLYHVENGLITLIGATTENPSFEVIAALVSRCRVIVLNSLGHDDMKHILCAALNDKDKGVGKMNLHFSAKALEYCIDCADGDVRTALNNLEQVAFQVQLPDLKSDNNDSEKLIGKNTGKITEKFTIDIKDVESVLQKKAPLYDKSGDGHYNLISAFHKSLRGSDPDAAIYWLARMLLSGEDPLYIIRRMVRFATEDIGNADPNALTVTLNTMKAFKFLGHPEGDDALAQAAIYLATAPKSNSIYSAFATVKKVVEKTGSLPVPIHIRNAPTKLMKDIGYGKGYKYAHNYKDGFVPQDYLPEELKGTKFYYPTERGYEKIVKQRLDGWNKLKT